MRLVHSFIAIAAGFVCIALLTGITTLLMRWLVPSWTRLPPSRSAQFFNLAATCLYSAIAGSVTALLAPISPLIHSLILAIIVLLVSAIAASELRGQALGFYPLALAVLPSLATLGAGIVTVLYH
jgi:Na+/citrate or Na+/malate symporter